jgi:hypothetical protein
MISNELRLLISEQAEKLPEYRKNLLAEFDWLHEVENIGIKYQLSPQQQEMYYQETAMVILDVAPAELYAKQLKERVGIQDKTIELIVKDIIERITNKIQQLSDTLYGDLAIEFRNELQKKFDEQGSLDQLKDIGLTISDTPLPADAIPTPNDKVKMTIAMEEQKVKSYDQSDPYHEPVE